MSDCLSRPRSNGSSSPSIIDLSELRIHDDDEEQWETHDAVQVPQQGQQSPAGQVATETCGPAEQVPEVSRALAVVRPNNVQNSRGAPNSQMEVRNGGRGGPVRRNDHRRHGGPGRNGHGRRPYYGGYQRGHPYQPAEPHNEEYPAEQQEGYYNYNYNHNYMHAQVPMPSAYCMHSMIADVPMQGVPTMGEIPMQGPTPMMGDSPNPGASMGNNSSAHSCVMETSQIKVFDRMGFVRLPSGQIAEVGLFNDYTLQHCPHYISMV